MLSFFFGVQRRFKSALASLSACVFAAFLLAATSSAVSAHEGHDDAPAATTTSGGSPRIVVHSDQYEIVGILKATRLTLYLDRFADNSPVVGARIMATLGNDEIAAEPGEESAYVVSSPRLSGHGPLEIVFSVSAPDGDDLLVGTLNLPPEPAAASTASATASLLDGVIRRLQTVWAGFGSPYAMPAATLAFGVLVGLALRRTPRSPSPVAAAVLVVLLTSTGYALAHEGHDHGPASAVAGSDSPQRLPDGSVFLPKPSQRLLQVRTAVTKTETAQRGIQLIGRVIADPNRSGIVQSINGGRVSAAERGLPRIGQTVRKGDVLASIEPALPQADRTTIAEKAGEIEQMIAIAETKLRRLRGLADANIAPRNQVVDAETELEGLRRRREIVRQVRIEPEVLRAPIDGIIASTRVVAGQVVQPQDVLFQIVDPEGFWAEALVYGDVNPGKIADATALGPDGNSMRLRFQGFSRALQQQATVVQFAILDPPSTVSVGQPLTVVARNGAEISGIILPRDAIVRSGNGDALVWLHTAPERFEGRPIRIEPFDAARVIIRDGLKAGERVVVRGAELINQVR